MLDHYLVERVKELTGGEQHPVMNRTSSPIFRSQSRIGRIATLRFVGLARS